MYLQERLRHVAFRRVVGGDRAAAAGCRPAARWPAAGVRPAAGNQHDLVGAGQRVRVAAGAARWPRGTWPTGGSAPGLVTVPRTGCPTCCGTGSVRQTGGIHSRRRQCWTPSRPRAPRAGGDGYDAGKRVRGRKRHLLVDTCGLVLSAVVSSVGAGPGRRPVGADRHLRAVSAARAGVVDGGYVNEIDAGLLGWANAQENLEIVAVPRNTAV